jgi:dCTP diphosphatase
MNDNKTNIGEIKQKISEFINARDWEQYHIPKDVALALSIEVSEILEHFRFKTDENIKEWMNDPKNKEQLADEIADSGIFLIDLARICNIDLSKAIKNKLEKSAKKYPVDMVKGKPHKYTYYKNN